MLRFIFHRVLTLATPIGRRLRPKAFLHAGPLIRTRSADLEAAGVERLPRVKGVCHGQPCLDDGRVIEAANVLWCTGFHPGFSWLELPIFAETGVPRHDAGVVPGEPGLYFVGLQFLYAFSSSMIHGVARDAARVAGAIAARVRAPQPAGAAAAPYGRITVPSRRLVVPHE